LYGESEKKNGSKVKLEMDGRKETQTPIHTKVRPPTTGEVGRRKPEKERDVIRIRSQEAKIKGGNARKKLQAFGSGKGWAGTVKRGRGKGAGLAYTREERN